MSRLRVPGPVCRVSLAVPLALCLLAHPAPARAIFPHHPGHEVHKEIEELETQWRKAQITGDTKTMANLLDDDYIGISANGLIQTKDEAIAQRSAGTLTITKLSFSDVKVRVFNSGNTAVVTSKAEITGTNGGQDISGRYRYTRVYARKLGAWKIVSFEASRMDDQDH
jgi:uncharacterized protein (TIGR02246 family)